MIGGMEKINRYLVFFTLLLWGSLLLRFWVFGELSNYLHPSFHLWVGITGLSLVILSAAWCWSTSGHTHAGSECCSCSLHPSSASPSLLPAGSRVAFSCLVLMFAFLAAFAMSTGSYTEVHLLNKQVITTPSQSPGLFSDERMKEVSELASDPSAQGSTCVTTLLLTSSDPLWRDKLRGRRVCVTGQVKRGKNSHIVRLLSTCCAADAQPIGVTIAPEAIERFSNGSWVMATGTLEFQPENGEFSPKLIDANLVATTPPRPSILY
jgi:uncharacterized repeat protein (TIGR03943 family)